MQNKRMRAHARLLGVMAHPTRLSILEELSRGMKCVNDIQEILGILQPNVSQYLAVLKENGLVMCEKAGTSRCYRVVKPSLIKGLFSVLGRGAAVKSDGPEFSREEGKIL